MIPTGVIGLAVDKLIVDKYMATLLPVGVAFLFQGSLVLSTRWGKGTRGTGSLTKKDAAAIGTMQGLSALSGLSRSGSTISVGMAMGLDRTAAARFSFLASIPALIAAAGLHVMEFTGSGEGFQPGMLLIGCAAAFVVGLASLKGLMLILRGTRFHLFAIYSFIFGATVLALYFMGY
jgi:undecaprenyl-diphosphatase